MRKLPFLLLLLAPLACGLLRAQNFSVTNGSAPVLSLDGLWRFHAGDNPAWAQPEFDDSGWSLLRSDRTWSSQGYKGYSGVGWYRFHVALPEGVNGVSILLPRFLTCYEVYANGRPIGGLGKMPPDPVPSSILANRTYPIPPSAVAGRQVEIAIRVWHWEGWVRYYGGGPETSGSLIGESKKIAELDAQSGALQNWNLTSLMILSLMESLGAAAALLLFLLRRGEREYLWFALIMAFGAAAGWMYFSNNFMVWHPTALNQPVDVLKLACIPLAQMAFYARLLKARPSLLYWVSLVCLLISLISPVFLHPGYNIEAYQFNLWISVLALPSFLWILMVVIAKAWQDVADARLLLLPALLQITATIVYQLEKVVRLSGWLPKGWSTQLLSTPFPISQTQAADFLFLLAVLGILIHRFTRTSSQEERFAGEVQAARNVQQYLIPKEMPQTPGLAIESEYHPAREVGGDFFQVLPHPTDGSVLIVVGDVAGKGMQAGMLAALIVGAIRTAAEFTYEPDRIMSLLNKRLQGRGLVTCLALHIERDGRATLANAGHLPPYLNGSEMPMEGALPLGAIPGIDFPAMHFKLVEGDTLMLMTDGVAEAQDAEGHLFGFDRIGEMLREGVAATALAAAARAFGQEDDITVLTVARAANAI